MYIVLFILFLFGLILDEIISPIAMLFINYKIIILVLFFLLFFLYSIYQGRKNKNIMYGIGIFLAYSQFWFFVLAAILSVSEVVHNENDAFLSSFVSVLMGGIAYVYSGFNYKMLVYSKEESNGHPMYYIIVGIIGWIINLIILF